MTVGFHYSVQRIGRSGGCICSFMIRIVSRGNVLWIPVLYWDRLLQLKFRPSNHNNIYVLR